MIEGVDDDSYKQVEDEQGSNDQVKHEEQNVHNIVVSLLDLVDFSSVKSVPHDINPSFCSHHIEHGDHGLTYIIEILLISHPVTSIVHAVPFGHDFLVDKLRHTIRYVTKEEFTLEECDSLDSKEHENERGDHHQVHNSRHRIE